jgi:AcrR family transcriptional regulator
VSAAPAGGVRSRRTGGSAAALRRRRPRRPSLTHEAFLAKALDIFLEQGFERATLDAITATAGIAKRTVYLRYGDKSALFRAALKQAIREWIIPVEQLRAAERGDLEDSLLAIGQILVDNVLSPAGLRLLRIVNAEAARIPELGAYSLHEGSDTTLDYLEDLLRRHLAQHGGDVDEAPAAASAFLHLVVGGPAYAAGWGLGVNAAEVERLVRYRVRLFVRGLLPAARADSSRLESENTRLKRLLGERTLMLDEAVERLETLRRTPETR